MTREEAHNGWLEISEFSLGECTELDKLINKIYNDFKSRTCENCNFFNGDTRMS